VATPRRPVLPGLGTVVIAGRTFRIVRLALLEGQLKITALAVAEADWPAVTGPATVYGADGQGVCQSWVVPIPAVAAGRGVQIELPLILTEVTAQDPDPA
jgi:hypothetical protein